MENAWSNGIAGERTDLTPIIEEEDKGQVKGFSSFFLFLSHRVHIKQIKKS